MWFGELSLRVFRTNFVPLHGRSVCLLQGGKETKLLQRELYFTLPSFSGTNQKERQYCSSSVNGLYDAAGSVSAGRMP